MESSSSTRRCVLVETQRPAKRTRAIGPMDLKPLGNPSLRVADSLETCHEPGPLLCLDVDIIQRVQNSFCFFFWLRFWIFFGFLSWYHLPCICNSLELESVILLGICYILAWSLCILHAICYIWQCVPSILHGICHVLTLQPLICMVFATFCYFKRSCGILESFFRLSFRVSFRVSLGFRLEFHLGFL